MKPRKKYLSWEPRFEVLLMDLWDENLVALRTVPHNSHVYAKMATALKEAGMKEVEWSSVRTKIENLLRKCKYLIKDGDESSGAAAKWHLFGRVRRIIDRTKLIHEEQSIAYTADSLPDAGSVPPKSNWEANPEQYTWTSDATRTLLELYLDNKGLFIDPDINKKQLWDHMGKCMADMGIPGLYASTLSKKFRDLKQTYDEIVLSDKSTGQEASKWEFYELMDEIFNQNVLFVEPEETLASMMKNEANEEELISWEHFSNCEAEFENASTLSTIVDASKDIEENLVSACPSESSTNDSIRLKRKRKAEDHDQKDHYHSNKTALQIEEERNEELKKMRSAMEHSNILQAERNEILRSLLKELRNK